MSTMKQIGSSVIEEHKKITIHQIINAFLEFLSIKWLTEVIPNEYLHKITHALKYELS